MTLTLQDGAALRQMRADVLEARFAGAEMTWFRQGPNFRLEDGDNVIVGEEAVYQDGVMTVTGRRKDPQLSRGDSQTTAQRFLVNERNGQMLAQGDVRTEIRGGSSGPRFFPAFSPSGTVLVWSEQAQLDREEVIYTGKVKAYQGNDFLFADRVGLNASGLVANGTVRSVLYRPSRGDLKKVVVEAAKLEYDGDRRVAAYSGGVQMRAEVGLVTALLLDLHFGKDNRIEQALARGGVAVRQGTRAGTGDQAEYDFQLGKIVLSGNFAEVVDPARGRTRGLRLTFFVGDDRILVES